MAKVLIIYLLLVSPLLSVSQTRETLQTYLEKTLSYQTLTYRSSGKDVRVTIFKVEFKDCTLNYNIKKKTGNSIEQYTVRIFLPRVSKINMAKTKHGNYVLTFSTNGKSIIKESPDGNLIHQKTQTIPLTKPNEKALQYLEKLRSNCQDKFSVTNKQP